MNHKIVSLLAICVCSLIFSGCSGSDKSSSTAAGRMVFKEQKENLRFDNTGMKRQVFDMNSDGQVDLWKFYTYKKTSDEEGEGELIIVRKELDLNFDGIVDRIMYYNQKENLMAPHLNKFGKEYSCHLPFCKEQSPLMYPHPRQHVLFAARRRLASHPRQPRPRLQLLQ